MAYNLGRMKKVVLSLIVFGAFVIYGLREKTQKMIEKPVLETPTTQPSLRDNVMSTGFISPILSATSTAVPTPLSSKNKFRDGSYTGSVADAFYGNIQVKAIIQNGQVSDVQFLQYPNDRRTSIEINTQAMPILRDEAIAAQSAHVDIVSGATDTSQAFIQSLGSALRQAFN